MIRYATFEHRKRKGIRVSIQLVDKHGGFAIRQVVYRDTDYTGSSCWSLPSKTLAYRRTESEALAAWRLLKKQYGKIFRSLGG